MWLDSGGPSQMPSGAFWALERLSKPKRLLHPIFNLFPLYFIKEMHRLPFLYPLRYIPTVNVWIWNSLKTRKSSLRRHQASLPPSLSTVQSYNDFHKSHLQTAKHTRTLSTFTQQREDTDQTENAKNGEKIQRKAQHSKPGAGSDEPHVDRRALPLRYGSSSPKLPETATFFSGRGISSLKSGMLCKFRKILVLSITFNLVPERQLHRNRAEVTVSHTEHNPTTLYCW